MPGYIRGSTLLSCIIRFGSPLFSFSECWVFTDEPGVQQDDVGAQDGFDHLQDTRVFGQVHRPRILHVNIMEAVLGVFCTWRYTQIYKLPIYKEMQYIRLIVSCRTEWEMFWSFYRDWTHYFMYKLGLFFSGTYQIPSPAWRRPAWSPSALSHSIQAALRGIPAACRSPVVWPSMQSSLLDRFNTDASGSLRPRCMS